MPIGASKVVSASSSSVSPSPSQRSGRRQRNPSSSASSTSRLAGTAPAASPRRAIQAIYDVARDVFAAAAPGFQPLPSEVARLSSLLNGLRLQDVGLDASMPYLSADPGEGSPTVTYLHFADSPKLSFGVFCLPQSAVIPLHDHPGMTVFSKILLGSLHIKSYDWVRSPPAGIGATRTSNGACLAKVNTDAVLDASSETVVLYPETGGNLHCFTATTPCVVLDVMGPPYCDTQGRDCTYYGVKATSDSGQYAWLKKVRSNFKLDTFHMGLNIRK